MAHARSSESSNRRGRLLGVSIGIFVLVVAVVVAGTLVITGKKNAPPPISAGDAKAHCVTLKFSHGILEQSVISAAENTTGMTYNCLTTFANPEPNWSDWEQPWMFATKSDGWDAWLAADSQHQAVVGIDLVPQTASDKNKNPLAWESACASGAYDQYATKLAQNMVSYGAGSVVIRLGIEANGGWEADYVGTTSAEMSAWGKCYDREVTAMRAVSGTHFLFVWNPNICTQDIPIGKWYPGNAYVDIIGADAYDLDCGTEKTVAEEGWTAYYTDTHSSPPNDSGYPSLANLEAFAKAHGKPLSFPEWGLGKNAGDDTAYVNQLAKMFQSDDVAFESYFDDGNDNIAELGPEIPKATRAYSEAFG
jgi:hypothetical protein